MNAFTHVALELHRYQQAERDRDQLILAQRRAQQQPDRPAFIPQAAPRHAESPDRVDALLGWSDAELAGLLEAEAPTSAPRHRELQSVGR